MVHFCQNAFHIGSAPIRRKLHHTCNSHRRQKQAPWLYPGVAPQMSACLRFAARLFAQKPLAFSLPQDSPLQVAAAPPYL
jgi:hypothetical protein